jgi:hypothetical protein
MMNQSVGQKAGGFQRERKTVSDRMWKLKGGMPGMTTAHNAQGAMAWIIARVIYLIILLTLTRILVNTVAKLLEPFHHLAGVMQ